MTERKTLESVYHRLVPRSTARTAAMATSQEGAVMDAPKLMHTHQVAREWRKLLPKTVTLELRAVILAIYAHSVSRFQNVYPNSKFVATLTPKQLLACTGVGRSTMKRKLDDLHALGIVKWTSKDSAMNTYTVYASPQNWAVEEDESDPGKLPEPTSPVPPSGAPSKSGFDPDPTPDPELANVVDFPPVPAIAGGVPPSGTGEVSQHLRQVGVPPSGTHLRGSDKNTTEKDKNSEEAAPKAKAEQISEVSRSFISEAKAAPKAKTSEIPDPAKEAAKKALREEWKKPPVKPENEPQKYWCQCKRNNPFCS